MVAITNTRRADSWTRDAALDLTPEQVARLTRPQRETRVRGLIEESAEILDAGIADLVGERTLVGTAILFSGGNDSTTLAHVMRPRATMAIHANTGIGVERTREFVREVCASWDLPLFERTPPEGSTYRDLVLDQGFPGPAHHWKMYQRLKERALYAVRRELVKHPRRERIVYLAGRRQEESARRADVPLYEAQGSISWVSPIVFWHKVDLNTYRLMHPEIPRNEVTDLIHMSGECLCGSFAQKDELDEIGFFFPEVREAIEALEAEVFASNRHPEWKCRWGWGADKSAIEKALRSGLSPEEVASLFARSTSGPLCSSCDGRASGGEVIAT